MTRRIVAALDRWWFTAAPARRPALVRIVVGAYTLWYLRGRIRMLQEISRTDPELFRPVGMARPLVRPVPPEVVRATTFGVVAANLAFVLGWRHRVSGPLFAALLLWTISYRNSWSMVFHNDNVLVLHAAVLGLTASADALSVDALTGRAAPTAGPHWRYGWPLNLMNAVTAASYFLAGVAKVKGPLGWGWAGGEALRSQVAMDGLRKEVFAKGAPPLGARLYPHVGVHRALAVGSLAAELGAPLALADRRVLRLWSVGAFAMHWGIYAVMGITFRHQMSGVMYGPAFDLERLMPRRPS